jgi:hypothetical protein
MSQPVVDPGDATLTNSTGEPATPVGEAWTDQEEAADSTKEEPDVLAVADPTSEGSDGLPDWPYPVPGSEAEPPPEEPEVP